MATGLAALGQGVQMVPEGRYHPDCGYRGRGELRRGTVIRGGIRPKGQPSAAMASVRHYVLRDRPLADDLIHRKAGTGEKIYPQEAGPGVVAHFAYIAMAQDRT
ncbi:hypothetical protein [Pseudoruegeria sp. SK021]|uniref:hypothetical protein n=1 Tax=Pseudoruegeria sp. SK021 TaxID=1933035 RepID=UPI00111C6BED|nr:hypothetical protein [Pseudoruegeria sp. SK021]